MGEDAQIENADEGFSLCPVLDDSQRSEEQEGIICSVDGSYAMLKQTTQHRLDELQPCCETTLGQSRNVRSAVSGETMMFQSGVVLDESQSIFANISRRSQFVVQLNGSTVHLPQPLDTHMKVKKPQLNNSASCVPPRNAKCREISPIRCAGRDDSERIATHYAQLYDPLRKTANDTPGSCDPAFNAKLKDQERKLMNGLKAIMHFCEEQARPSSKGSTAGTVITALARSGSSSSVSTGRDALTKEVRNLRQAFAGIDFASRAAAGRDHEESIADSFAMTDEMITIEQPPSGSRGSSTVEQARHSSAHLLADRAIHDADICSKALRFGDSSHVAVKETGTNTQGETVCVKHHIITHRVKTVPGHHRQHRRDNTSLTLASHKPIFQPFNLDSRRILIDIDSIPNLGNWIDKHKEVFDGADTADSGRERAMLHRRIVGGGKRGRPAAVGRGLYGRNRTHFRPTVSHHVTQRIDDEKQITTEPKTVCNRDAATSTEEQAVLTLVEASTVNIVAKDEMDMVDEENITLDSASKHVKNQHHKKHGFSKKMPFVGSGEKGNTTFSISGNQQQVMKIIGTRFQEWLPVVRSIIYDAHCKDYAKALQRDLARQKLCHAEQLRSLEADLKNCRNDAERHEVHAEIYRHKQQWTRKHDRVLTRLNEHTSRGGVWSKVQQLRTIHAALST